MRLAEGQEERDLDKIIVEEEEKKVETFVSCTKLIALHRQNPQEEGRRRGGGRDQARDGS